jgi:hypothetical protein
VDLKGLLVQQEPQEPQVRPDRVDLKGLLVQQEPQEPQVRPDRLA